MRICVKKVGALKRRLHYRAVTSLHFYKWWVVDATDNVRHVSIYSPYGETMASATMEGIL